MLRPATARRPRRSRPISSPMRCCARLKNAASGGGKSSSRLTIERGAGSERYEPQEVAFDRLTVGIERWRELRPFDYRLAEFAGAVLRRDPFQQPAVGRLSGFVDQQPRAHGAGVRAAGEIGL